MSEQNFSDVFLPARNRVQPQGFATDEAAISEKVIQTNKEGQDLNEFVEFVLEALDGPNKGSSELPDTVLKAIEAFIGSSEANMPIGSKENAIERLKEFAGDVVDSLRTGPIELSDVDQNIRASIAKITSFAERTPERNNAETLIEQRAVGDNQVLIDPNKASIAADSDNAIGLETIYSGNSFPRSSEFQNKLEKTFKGEPEPNALVAEPTRGLASGKDLASAIQNGVLSRQNEGANRNQNGVAITSGSGEMRGDFISRINLDTQARADSQDKKTDSPGPKSTNVKAEQPVDQKLGTIAKVSTPNPSLNANVPISPSNTEAGVDYSSLNGSSSLAQPRELNQKTSSLLQSNQGPATIRTQKASAVPANLSGLANPQAVNSGKEVSRAIEPTALPSASASTFPKQSATGQSVQGQLSKKIDSNARITSKGIGASLGVPESHGKREVGHSDRASSKTVEIDSASTPTSMKAAILTPMQFKTASTQVLSDSDPVLPRAFVSEIEGAMELRSTTEFQSSGRIGSEVVNTKADLPRNISQQMAEAFQRSGSRQVELHLNPIELGRVKISLHTADSGVMVHCAR